MGKNCDSKWLPFLLKELKSSDAEMRYEAVGALGEIGNEDIVQYLMPVANDHRYRCSDGSDAGIGENRR